MKPNTIIMHIKWKITYHTQGLYQIGKAKLDFIKQIKKAKTSEILVGRLLHEKTVFFLHIIDDNVHKI